MAGPKKGRRVWYEMWLESSKEPDQARFYRPD